MTTALLILVAFVFGGISGMWFLGKVHGVNYASWEKENERLREQLRVAREEAVERRARREIRTAAKVVELRVVRRDGVA